MTEEKSIWIKCTEGQYKQIKEEAKKEGLTVSNFGLSKMLGLTPAKVKKPKLYSHNVKGKNGKIREYSREVVTKKTILINPKEIVEDVLPDIVSMLVDEDETVCGRIAETNACGFELNDYEIQSVKYNSASSMIEFTVKMYLVGEQIEDKCFGGDKIEIDLSGRLIYSDKNWEINDYKIRFCDIMDT